MVIFKLAAQCKKAGSGWWFRPIIPATGGSNLSYIVKLYLKIKEEGLGYSSVAEHVLNKCEILGSPLNSAIKTKSKSSAYVNPLGNYRRDLRPGAQICGKLEIQASTSQIPNLDSLVDSSFSPASVCPHLLLSRPQFPLL